MPKISIIAAIGKNRELGKGNKLLWHISEDLRRFKQLTTGHAVIMGRKTFESIGHPLPNRTNIVVTRDKNCSARGCIITHSIKEALQEAKKQASHKAASAALNRDRPQSVSGSWVFIIGGAQIYQQTIDIADRLYLTLIHSSFPDADAFFPDYSDFSKTVAKQTRSSAGYTFTFLTLDR